jgi:hypothetical protein
MDKKTKDELEYLAEVESLEPRFPKKESPYRPIKLLSTSALAQQLDIAASTLREYRLEHKGPAYVKIGHLVRYRLVDVVAWLATLEHSDS